MKMSKGLIPALFCLTALSCQNSGNSPGAVSTDRDYMALALAIAPTTTYTIPGDVNDCSFNGAVVTENSSITAYSNSSVPYGQACVSEVRTCAAGALSGSFSYSSCTVGQPASCLFNGQTVANGDSITAYTNSNVPAGDTCTPQSRTCNNGVLSGSNQYASCSVDAPASCLFNGQTVASGQSIPAFLTSSVASGQECQLEYRTCDNGVLSGSNQYSSCSVEAPSACLFNGQTIASGQSVEAFATSSVQYGSFCISDTRTCNNGVLSGSNQFASCQVGQPSACLFNGQTIAHGQTVNAFAASNVEYGQMCQAESRVCDNGHLSGSYTFASCDAGQAASCLFNGQTIPHGSSVTAFESSSVTNGNSCGSQQRVCDNGTLSGTFTFASCEVQAPKACLFNGQTIVSGQSIVAYHTATVAKNALCEGETRTCTDGVLSGSFTNLSCITQVPPGHDDDDDDVQICKLVVQIKHNEHYSQHPNNGLHLGWYKYKERFNCGKHKGWYVHNNRSEHPTVKNQTPWCKDKDSSEDDNDQGENHNGQGQGNGNGNGNEHGNGNGNQGNNGNGNSNGNGHRNG